MGNKVGWIISGLLVAVGSVIFVIFMWFPSPSDPTMETKAKGRLDMHKLSIPVTTIAPEPTGSGNAGEDYAKALEIWNSGKISFSEKKNKFSNEPIDGDIGEYTKQVWTGKKHVSDDDLAQLNKINEHLAAGAGKKEMKFTLVCTPNKELVVNPKYKPASDLRRVGLAMGVLAGDLRDKQKFDEAKKILQNAFLMGRHMTDERVHPWMTIAGLQVQVEAIGQMSELYRAQGDKVFNENLNTLNDYLTAITSLGTDCDTKMNILRKMNVAPGDVFNIIMNDQDPSWRVQAVLMLGNLKFKADTNTRGDIRYIRKLLDEATSGDVLDDGAAQIAPEMKESVLAALKAAAKAADAYTVDQFKNAPTDYTQD